jgi:flagellar biosynthesis protein FlhA
MGFLIPAVAFRDGARVAPNEYEVLLYGDKVAGGTIYAGKTLAIHASTQAEKLPGISTHDPAFGLPATWIDEGDAERARNRGYTLVDPVTVLMTHVSETIKAHVAALLTRAETMTLLEGVRGRHQGLVEELVPNVLAPSDVQRVFQGLLAEGVPIRNVDLIIETLVDAGRHKKDPAVLTELVRQRLGLSICQNLRGSQPALSVLTMDPVLEHSIAQSLQAAEAGGGFALDPKVAEQFMRRLLQLAESMMRNNLMPVLLCAPELRRQVKTFTRRALPRLAVLSVAEVPHSVDLKSFGVVALPEGQLS